MSEFDKFLAHAAGRLGIELTDLMCHRFSQYYRLLVEWNERFNLTSLSEMCDIVIKHFVDSLTCFLIYDPPVGARVVDIGSGAGFPGLPIKIVREDLQVTLVESVGKKVNFLHHVLDVLGFGDVDVVPGRAEEIAHEPRYRASFDLALARAVAELPVLLELALPFLQPSGYFIAMKGPAVQEELAMCDDALRILGGSVKSVKTIFLPVAGDQRKLILIEKIGLTPDKYPRRPGVPQRRPL
ncbi:16S rRNA (guanine(527)-N(7))-methyltransferase RsmG [Desulfofundulus sp.]|uniref:16S rRNA (guanine(527)-N(7))-methyltransferase RsmG n=1 Tax=Desulfofundulus sp. TaxID=2282750 RepID=UPI003C714A41